ncbi:MAG: purine-nucleoside phosphorylase [Geminicoccaceae bacterium]|nr:purine-nucleoside phosphorylase [Geminicoccaceae bacterium]
MEELFAAAATVRARAWAPYSGFAVGAALRAESGRIFAGCNVENAAYPLSQCAEASALGALVAAGERRVLEILVVGEGPPPCVPCGGCRQRLAEFAAPDAPVGVALPDGRLLLRTTLGALLPFPFRFRSETAVVGESALDRLREAARALSPVAGLVLGSGLGAVAERIEPVLVVEAREIAGFPVPSVAGHRGRLILGRLAGVPLLCLEGRAHLYEGHPPAALARPVRLLRELGCRVVVLASAVGSLRPAVPPGSLVLVSDHLNLQGANPLMGPADERIGPRFPALDDLYDPGLRALLHRAAGEIGLELAEGVLAAMLGPCFETPAEIRMLRRLGADLVSMSMVPEAIAARHCGLRVAGIGVVTNLAAGLAAAPPSHAETLARAAAAADELARLLVAALPELARCA